MTPALSTELSEREIFLIGSIVSQWGFLEADIFDQTLMSYADWEELPASMNNAQFSEVLKLWQERVVNQQDTEKNAVLKTQFDEIVALGEYRQAIVHSRWEWQPNKPDEITAVRVHKKHIKRVTFSADDLLEFSSRLGEVRYWINYPGGQEHWAAQMASTGGYISRKGWELLTGRTTLDELLPNKNRD